jgi:hypothetical protein
MINPCGNYCNSKCPYYLTQCEGCDKINGKVFWAKEYEADCCPIYKCAKSKGYIHCGYCVELPCETWQSTRDPAQTDDALWEKDIQERINRFKNI